MVCCTEEVGEGVGCVVCVMVGWKLLSEMMSVFVVSMFLGISIVVVDIPV